MRLLIYYKVMIWSKIVEHCKKIFLKAYITIEKTIIKFGDIEIQKQKFHQYKGPISIKCRYW